MPSLSGVRNGPGARAQAVIPVPASPAGQAAGELDHGALAGGVPGPGGGPGQAQRAGHGQDAAVPGGAHRRGGRAAGQPGAGHAVLQAGPQVGHGELVQGAAGLDPGAGHQHVEAAMPGQDLLGQGGGTLDRPAAAGPAGWS
jgi:hypothetical protein